jgi:two-component system, response regulator
LIELPRVTSHFLLVEDDPDQIALVIRALDDISSRIEPIICHDGAEALESLRAAVARGPGHLPRFVLLDATMPRVDGFQVLRKIRSDPATGDLPVVMFSSSTLVEDVERAYNLGVTAYCAKPISFSDFVHILLAVLVQWGGHVMEAVHQWEHAILDRYFKGPHGLFSA